MGKVRKRMFRIYYGLIFLWGSLAVNAQMTEGEPPAHMTLGRWGDGFYY